MKHIYSGEVCMFIERNRLLLPGEKRKQPAQTALEYLKMVQGKRIPIKIGETVLGVVHSFKIQDNRVIGTYDAYEGGDAKE